mgnify:CR=1 FL=1
MRAVLGQHRHSGAGWQTQTLQMSSHAPRLIQRLSPTVLKHLTTAHRLSQKQLCRAFSLMLVDIFKDQFVAHGISSAGWKMGNLTLPHEP